MGTGFINQKSQLKIHEFTHTALLLQYLLQIRFVRIVDTIIELWQRSHFFYWTLGVTD